MILTIRGWEFDTRELSDLPQYLSPRLPDRVRAVIEDGGRLAVAYYHAGYHCKRLSEELGISYRIARQALAWYGIWPAKPAPLRGWNGGGGKGGNGRRGPKRDLPVITIEPQAAPPPPKPESPTPEPLTRALFREIVARAYLRNDRCPPGCVGRETCLDPEGSCYWYNGNGRERAQR